MSQGEFVYIVHVIDMLLARQAVPTTWQTLHS